MDFFEAIFMKILNMSITASYVIVAVLLIRFCIRKIPKIFSYTLWSVVAFRLLSPISFSSIISIFNFKLFDMTVAQRGGNGTLIYIPSAINAVVAPKVTVGIPFANSFISESMIDTRHNTNMDIIPFVVSVATIVWSIGIAVLLIYSIISYIKVKSKVDNAILVEKNIYECDNIVSPFVLGFIKPKIYMPFRMDQQEREYILCHEECHIRRLDYIIKPLAFLILMVYWFNPIVWIAYLCMCQDMEMSCDEKVLSDLGIAIKKDYSMSLLSFSTKHHFTGVSPLAFGKSEIKSRVKNVLNYRKHKKGFIVVITLLCIGVIIACATNPKSEKMALDNSTMLQVEELQTDGFSDIYGYYKFSENIYTNPLSSFMAAKGHMPYYRITKDDLIIIDNKNGTIQEFDGNFDKKALTKEDFKLLFDFYIPDISQYSEIVEYAVFPTGGSREYRLYITNNEVWLSDISNNKMWSIYRLMKSENININTISETSKEGLVLPTEGFIVELYSANSIKDTSFLRDDASIAAITEIVLNYELKSAGGFNVDVETVGDYFRFYSAGDTNRKIYYAFSNEIVSEKSQMQMGNDIGNNRRVEMSIEHYESLYALWESNRELQ